MGTMIGAIIVIAIILKHRNYHYYDNRDLSLPLAEEPPSRLTGYLHGTQKKKVTPWGILDPPPHPTPCALIRGAPVMAASPLSGCLVFLGERCS